MVGDYREVGAGCAPGKPVGRASPVGLSHKTWMIIGLWMAAVAVFFILVGYLGAINF